MNTAIFNNNWKLVTLLQQIKSKLRIKSTDNFENTLKKSSLLINDSIDKFLMHKIYF